MSKKRSKTDYLSIDIDMQPIHDMLSGIQANLRKDVLQKATLKVAKDFQSEAETAFRSVASADAVADMIENPTRKHSKSKKLKPTGLFADTSFNKRDAVISISPKYSDFRFHFFESGTETRQTSKGYNRGQMPKKSFFWPTFQSRGKELADALAREINDLLKKI